VGVRAGGYDLLTILACEVDCRFYKFLAQAFTAEFLIYLSMIDVYSVRARGEIVESRLAFAVLFDKKGPFPTFLFVFDPHFYQTKGTVAGEANVYSPGRLDYYRTVMKITHLLSAFLLACSVSIAAAAQATVVINDPTIEAPKIQLSDAERAVFEKRVLPVVKPKLDSDACDEPAPEITGRAEGSFTRAGASQTLLFYQYCQTGNGIGSVGVAVIENGKVVASVVSAEGGWSDRAVTIPDVNQNGLDEIALYYSGGMHQGAGGTGVDIMEFSNGALKGLGWFQAEEFSETSPVMGYKIVAHPAKTPTFTREKFVQNAAGKWRKAGAPITIKLKPAVVEFESAK